MQFDAIRLFAEGQNDFALALYRELCQTPGNVFFSPFSIRVALGMIYAGARGETAAQMREVLCFPSNDETPHMTFANIIQRLNTTGDDRYEMAVANSLWSQDGAQLLPEFRKLVLRHYGGGVNLVDFCRNAEDARMTINRWVENKTRQKIKELLPPDVLDADTRLVLVNAIYFKGVWVQQFPEDNTDDRPFYLEGGRKVKTPMMYQQKKFEFFQTKGFQVINLDYKDSDLSMLVLLPDCMSSAQMGHRA